LHNIFILLEATLRVKSFLTARGQQIKIYLMKDEEKIFANALNQAPQLGPVSLGNLKKYFGSFKKAWSASFDKLQKVSGARDLFEFRQNIDPEKKIEKLQKENIKILLKEELPYFLQEIYTPPEILYVKGELPNENLNHLAVVGPRKFSTYGKEACQKIINGLKEHNVVIVSGLAAGIDTIAHIAALENNLQTIAVLGHGLDPRVLFPQDNMQLADKITKNGCVISEYSYSTRATKFTFPQRNRIAAGLSQGTLVIEAPERSGSLITATMALESNREVFAVPNNIFSKNSEGTNKLLKEGAVPVTEPEDILKTFGIDIESKPQNIVLSETEQKIISFLDEPIERDELIRKSGMQPQEINPQLIQMQIKGIIKEIDGKIYQV